MSATLPQAAGRHAGWRGLLPCPTEIIEFLRQWNFWPFQFFPGGLPLGMTGTTMSAGAVFVEVSESFMPPDIPLVPPRRGADTEFEALLAEIPSWDDHTLLHMYRRFGESRLFRMHHLPENPLTERTQRLLAAAQAEILARGLQGPDGNA